MKLKRRIVGKSPLDYALEEVKNLKQQLKDAESELKTTRDERELIEIELNLVKREREKEQRKHHLLREYIFLNG